MKKYLFPKLPDSYLVFFSWLIVGIIMLVSLRGNPLNGPLTGDEPYYITEYNYLCHYGFYQSLAQGDSFGYTFLLFILSKVAPVNILVLMKLFSAACTLLSCFTLLKILNHFEDIKFETKYLGMVFFAFIANYVTWRGLPDTANALFTLLSFLVLLKGINVRSVILAALLIFIAFIIKPVALFYVPGLVLYLLVRKGLQLKQRAVYIVVFSIVFLGSFAAYHTPGYRMYGHLMLEDKGHGYAGSARVPYTPTWNQRNIYYEVYNPGKKINKWAVNFDEVAAFEKNNPGKLDLSFTGYVTQHFDVWSKNAATKIFLDLPYNVDTGMFYHKWTFINRWIKNDMVIKFIALLIFLACCYKERSFIKKNAFLLVPLVYYLFLSLYVIPQLESNWLISCLPFFALPLYQFLERRIGAYIILLGQLAMVFYYHPL